MRVVHFNDWGVIEYGEAWERQEALLKQGLEAKQAWYNTPAIERAAELTTENNLIFCSHPHVYTIGKSGHMENLLVNDTRLQELGVSFYKTNRGGDITYHGPGQVVAYPVLDLEHFYTDLGKYMRNLEEVIIRTLLRYGIKSERLQGSTGVWLDTDNPQSVRKICAMGVKCSRWMTIHGLALNVNTDLAYFGYIVPCGIGDKKVTSMRAELGREIDELEVKNIIREEFAKVFEAEILASANIVKA